MLKDQDHSPTAVALPANQAERGKLSYGIEGQNSCNQDSKGKMTPPDDGSAIHPSTRSRTDSQDDQAEKRKSAANTSPSAADHHQKEGAKHEEFKQPLEGAKPAFKQQFVQGRKRPPFGSREGKNYVLADNAELLATINMNKMQHQYIQNLQKANITLKSKIRELGQSKAALESDSDSDSGFEDPFEEDDCEIMAIGTVEELSRRRHRQQHYQDWQEYQESFYYEGYYDPYYDEPPRTDHRRFVLRDGEVVPKQQPGQQSQPHEAERRNPPGNNRRSEKSRKDPKEQKGGKAPKETSKLTSVALERDGPGNETSILEAAVNLTFILTDARKSGSKRGLTEAVHQAKRNGEVQALAKSALKDSHAGKVMGSFKKALKAAEQALVNMAARE